MSSKLFGRGRSALEDDGEPGEAMGAPVVDARLLKASRPRLVTPAADPAVDYAQLGGHVATVLEAATAAAEKLRVEAQAEAQQVRAKSEEQARDALETAKATEARAEAHAAGLAAEAEREGKEVRAKADIYASSRRQAADEEAAAVLARAEKQAALRERSSQERQRTLDQSVVRTEKRLRQLVVGLHELASGLAELVPAQDEDEDGDERNGSLAEGVLTRSGRQSRSSSRGSESA